MTHEFGGDNETATTITRACDDLDVALDALRQDALTRVAIDGSGSLRALTVVGTSDADVDLASLPVRQLAILGCRRLIELVHNQQLHKAEAVGRGALALLGSLLEVHAGDDDVEAHASRAIRALAFRSDVARQAAGESTVIAGLVSIVRRVVNAIEAVDAVSTTASAVASETSTAASEAKDSSVAPAISGSPAVSASSIVAADEAMTTLTLLVHMHPVNVGVTLDADGHKVAGHAIATFTRLAQCVPSPLAGAELPVAANALKKATMLQLLLE